MNSKLTTYDRATPEARAGVRFLALLKICPDCGAKIGERCRSISGKPAKPHWIRRKHINL